MLRPYPVRMLQPIKFSAPLWEVDEMPPPLDLPYPVRVTCVKPSGVYKTGDRVYYVGPSLTDQGERGTVLNGGGDWYSVMWDKSLGGFKHTPVYKSHIAPAPATV